MLRTPEYIAAVERRRTQASTYNGKKRRVLFVSSMHAYLTMMDRWYYHLFVDAANSDVWEAAIWGPGMPAYDGRLSLAQNLHQNYPGDNEFSAIFFMHWYMNDKSYEASKAEVCAGDAWCTLKRIVMPRVVHHERWQMCRVVVNDFKLKLGGARNVSICCVMYIMKRWQTCRVVVNNFKLKLGGALSVSLCRVMYIMKRWQMCRVVVVNFKLKLGGALSVSLCHMM